MTGYFTIDKDKLAVNKNELANRLLVSRTADLSDYESAAGEIRQAAFPKCCCIRTELSFCDDYTVDLGFAKVKSRDLYKNLNGCKSAFVFAVTLGHEVDRVLSRLGLVSESKHFICDGYASALAECACDAAEEMIKESLKCRPRFSPGYGDLPLALQQPLLNFLNASKMLGVTLTESLLMTPQKTVSAIMGITDDFN